MSSEVTVDIPYTIETGEPLVNETFGPNNIRRRRSGAHEGQRVSLHNGRLMADQLSLDREGFIFVQHNTQVADFFDPSQLTAVYYSEVEQLIKKTSGALRVVIFDHTLRSGDESEREAKLIREPVLSAHNDYTEWSGPNRVREALPAEADALLARRFAIIQVWRAINQPIQSNPLAVADAQSVAMEDLLVAERRYPHRVGQTYRLKYNPKHRWFYFPEMRRDEALVFKVYDSEKDGRARFTPHTSFVDPATPPKAPPRQSIEVRAFAFF
ncbi:MAG TPA: CmcJ/NvfI family oxidoreductase [Candidatus Binatia bacterium]|nr:CmcJ/NvfI family oxidoreductase [Candidatus Binatia bacterium]